MRSGPSVNARVGFGLRRGVGRGKTNRVSDEPLMGYVALGANLGDAAGALRLAAVEITGWSLGQALGEFVGLLEQIAGIDKYHGNVGQHLRGEVQHHRRLGTKTGRQHQPIIELSQRPSQALGSRRLLKPLVGFARVKTKIGGGIAGESSTQINLPIPDRFGGD